jgi:hypothetical protein
VTFGTKQPRAALSGHQGPNRRGPTGRAVRSSWLPILVTIAPLVFGAAYLTLRSGDFSPFGDGAYLELHVRDIGEHLVLLGPFSRYGWSHPGPAIYEVLAPFYRLGGGSFRAVAVAALLINAACVVTLALTVRRLVGHAAMLWTLFVISLYLLVLGPDELRNSWNPILPVLPFAVVVALCWALVEGERWALPAVAALSTFAVQSHVSFAVPTAALWLTTAVALLRHRAPRRSGEVSENGKAAPTSIWVRPVTVSVLVLGLLWAPPLWEQTRRRPGNLVAISRYFRASTPDGTWREGWRWVLGDLGAFPAKLLGQSGTVDAIGVPGWPAWAVVVALVAFAAALVPVWRRAPRVRMLIILATVVAAVGLISIRRISGPLYPYLAAWTLVAGLLLWSAYGAGLLARTPVTTMGALIAIVALVVPAVPSMHGQARAETAWVYTDGVTPQLRAGVVAWLGSQPGVVRLDARPRSAAEFLDVRNRFAALLLALRKSGVDVQASEEWRGALGDRYVSRAATATTTLSLMAAGAEAPAGQEPVARAGPFLVYGSR